MDISYKFNRYRYTVNVYGGYDDIDDIVIDYGITVSKYDTMESKLVEYNSYTIDGFNKLLDKRASGLPEKVILKALKEKLFRKEGDIVVVNV